MRGTHEQSKTDKQGRNKTIDPPIYTKKKGSVFFSFGLLGGWVGHAARSLHAGGGGGCKPPMP